jgi:hypothetical protein
LLAGRSDSAIPSFLKTVEHDGYVEIGSAGITQNNQKNSNVSGMVAGLPRQQS